MLRGSRGRRIVLQALLLAVLLAGATLHPAGAGTARADREYSWTLDKDGRPLAAPLPYRLDAEIDGMYLPSGTFKNPADLFIDGAYNVWVADTGNNRVLKFAEDGTFLAELGTGGGEGQDPRSDVWYGPGWTEWELVTAARPRFPGHRRPPGPRWSAPALAPARAW